MSEVVPFRRQTSSGDIIIEKLIKAGYLQPTQRHDADAIASAIFQMKKDLRGDAGDNGPAVA